MVFGDIYPTKYMGTTTDTFGRLKSQLPLNLQYHFKPKVMLQEEKGKGISVECMECLNEDA